MISRGRASVSRRAQGSNGRTRQFPAEPQGISPTGCLRYTVAGRTWADRPSDAASSPSRQVRSCVTLARRTRRLSRRQLTTSVNNARARDFDTNSIPAGRGRQPGMIDDLLPHPIEAAAARRAELSAHCPTAAQVGIAMGMDGKEAISFVNRLRTEGILLGVYRNEPSPHWRYPAWQFDTEHRPIPQFAEILAILRAHGQSLGERDRTSGWNEVEWFMSPHVLLDGQRPCEVLQKDPEGVLDATRAQFIEDGSNNGF